MISQDVKVNVSVGTLKEFEPLPKDTYAVEVLDVELKDEKAYQSEDTVTNVVFTFVVIEEGPHYGRRFWAHASPKLVTGKKSSKLYDIISTLTEKSYTNEELEKFALELTPDFLNSFIGSQLRLVLGQKPKQDGSLKNVIDGFLPKKELLNAFDETKVKKAE